MSENVITSYKGFDKNMECRGFQYEVGREYEMDEEIGYYNRGFHACKSPLGMWGYCDMLNSRFAEVEQSGKIDENEKSTGIYSSRIKINTELKLSDIIIIVGNTLFCSQKDNISLILYLYSQTALPPFRLPPLEP